MLDLRKELLLLELIDEPFADHNRIGGFHAGKGGFESGVLVDGLLKFLIGLFMQSLPFGHAALGKKLKLLETGIQYRTVRFIITGDFAPKLGERVPHCSEVDRGALAPAWRDTGVLVD